MRPAMAAVYRNCASADHHEKPRDRDRQYQNPYDRSDQRSSDMSASPPPVHPIASMQGPFEESIVESSPEFDVQVDGLVATHCLDAKARRRRLLEADHFDASWGSRWGQRPSAQYHPINKLIAQISFGIHLLQQDSAKSNEEVTQILQTHINDVDNFLERTSDDFDVAIGDADERIRYLSFPMQHMDVLNKMLDDRGFRDDLLDGNDQIERIVDRTTKAMHAALFDMHTCARATQEFKRYLDSISDSWPHHQDELTEIFCASVQIAEGWLKYLTDLQTKAKQLGNSLGILSQVILDISKYAGAAKERDQTTKSHVVAAAVTAKPPQALHSRLVRSTHAAIPKGNPMLDKPLPKAPSADGEHPSRIPIASSALSSRKYESPRASPPTPPSHKSPHSSISLHDSPMSQGSLTRSRRSSETIPRVKHHNFSAPLTRYKHLEPLRSNPPDQEWHHDRLTHHGASDVPKSSECAETSRSSPKKSSTPDFAECARALAVQNHDEKASRPSPYPSPPPSEEEYSDSANSGDPLINFLHQELASSRQISPFAEDGASRFIDSAYHSAIDRDDYHVSAETYPSIDNTHAMRASPNPQLALKPVNPPSPPTSKCEADAEREPQPRDVSSRPVSHLSLFPSPTPQPSIQNQHRHQHSLSSSFSIQQRSSVLMAAAADNKPPGEAVPSVHAPARPEYITALPTSNPFSASHAHEMKHSRSAKFFASFKSPSASSRHIDRIPMPTSYNRSLPLPSPYGSDSPPVKRNGDLSPSTSSSSTPPRTLSGQHRQRNHSSKPQNRGFRHVKGSSSSASASRGHSAGLSRSLSLKKIFSTV